ncbi:hypothetical protein CkaCkLH20_01959 [Colletotrichum karsti]|uniref:Uncharacterized protein n=1 Tax=Colletotrichum karsti TaxID=1095194 RepID=A0A9P6ICK5_9PEZI|nr:uncharacterized protein CkaCkLH20_01959 [Colletotrichum karsti]KAF9880917.1 hypothetical protein CkaCkLH20_01959 [Colletotrichum karsti]
MLDKLNLDPNDIKTWIADETFTDRSPSSRTSTDNPDTDVIAKLAWFLRNKYIFDKFGTKEDQRAVDAAVKAMPASTGMGKAVISATAMCETITADVVVFTSEN